MNFGGLLKAPKAPPKPSELFFSTHRNEMGKAAVFQKFAYKQSSILDDSDDSDDESGRDNDEDLGDHKSYHKNMKGIMKFI